MGAYLSTPKTEKFSEDMQTDSLTCGASSMQGWRVSQEDAHNCVLRLDSETSLFAVYDGHGGAEVAKYCSLYLPEYICAHPEYKKGNLEEALRKAFVEFDGTLTKPEVIAELKSLAQIESDSEDEEETAALFKEAEMPLKEVLAKYNGIPLKDSSHLHHPKEKPMSPMLHAKKDTSNGENPEHINGEIEKNEFVPLTQSSPKDSPKEEEVEETKEEQKEDHTHPNNIVENETLDSSSQKKSEVENETLSCPNNGPSCSVDSKPCSSSAEPSSSFQKDDLQDDSGSSETSDEEYAGSGSSEEGEDDEDESGCIDEEDSEDEEPGVSEGIFSQISQGKEEPGSDSGCTAVVALLRGNSLYVANAGDSRCVVCRKGEAVDMSTDHKPDDIPERTRIERAGGQVTPDGRVNGGLNLSRAIGDHSYKQNKDLGPEEQMITALPDVRHLELEWGKDEFLVIACDGIWNFMSSQQVVDFIRERLPKHPGSSLSSICEELFDHCLSPNTQGDGTGCDNMTCIIVKLPSSSSANKRPSSEILDSTDSKRPKLEEA